jgi:hypothetical protein
VEAVRDLDCVGCAEPGAFAVATGAVAANHLGTMMRAQPGGERVAPPVGQHVNRSAGVHVDYDGAVGVAAAKREIVRPDRRRIARCGQRKRADQSLPWTETPPPRVAGQPLPRSAAERHRDLLQHPAQQRSPPGVRDRDTRDLFANVRFAHSLLPQKNRRTCNRITVSCPPTDGSDSRA